MSRKKPAANVRQTSLDQLPSETAAPFIVWETRTMRRRRRKGEASGEPRKFHQTACKGHTFQVHFLPKGPDKLILQMLCDFNRDGEMEFMSSLFGATSTEDALELAEKQIASFFQHRRDSYR